MPTSAWRFSGTEGADDAVVKLKGLAAQDLIEVQDLAVIRWPRWAAEAIVQEHVTEEGGRVSALVGRRRHAVIDSSIIEAAKGDMTPGTSVIVMLSANAHRPGLRHQPFPSADTVILAWRGVSLHGISAFGLVRTGP